MLLDVTVSGAGIGAFALFCPLMMVLMMFGMAFMGGHGHGGSHHGHREEDEQSK